MTYRHFDTAGLKKQTVVVAAIAALPPTAAHAANAAQGLHDSVRRTAAPRPFADWTEEARRDLYEERAAIMEYDGGLSVTLIATENPITGTAQQVWVINAGIADVRLCTSLIKS